MSLALSPGRMNGRAAVGATRLDDSPSCHRRQRRRAVLPVTSGATGPVARHRPMARAASRASTVLAALYF